MIAAGKTHKDVAAAFDVHTGSVSRWAIKPAFKEEVERLRKEAESKFPHIQPEVVGKAVSMSERNYKLNHVKLMDLATKSLKSLDGLLDELEKEEGIGALRLKKEVCFELLSRAGFSPIKQVDVRQTSVTTKVESDQIAALKERVKAIDVTPKQASG